MDERGLHSLSFRYFEAQFLFFVGFSFLLTSHICSGASVTGVSPRYGSLAGGTRVTVSGTGFAGDQFSTNNDPNVGNWVTLASSSQTFPCETHKDGTTEVQVMCYTPEKMPEDDYYVKVKVDGVAVGNADLCNNNPTSDNCRFRPIADNTPTVEEMLTQSGRPGDYVTLEGDLFSDRYGSNLAASTNGKLQKFLRAYVGPRECELKNGDVFYGLALDSSDTDYGYLKCKTQGTSVGFFNVSFLIESPYGRSLPDPTLYRVSYNDKIYMYQTYTDVTSITPSTGSTEGGLSLTVYGNSFDNRLPYTSPKVFIDGTVCVVTSVVVDSHIVCTVAEDPQSTDTDFPGGRGVDFEYWTTTSVQQSNIGDVLTFTDATAGYNYMRLDETSYFDISDTMDSYVSRMTTFFFPPHSGTYQFILEADDGASLFVDGTLVTSTTNGIGYSTRRTLSNTQKYLLQVVHFETTGDSWVSLGAKFFDTKFTSAATEKADQEKQKIVVTSTVVREIQELTFSNFASQTASYEVQSVTVDTGGNFRFGLSSVYTEPLNTNMPDTQLSAAMSSLPCLASSESISVARQLTATSSTAVTYHITFNSPRGNFPDVSVVTEDGKSTVTHTVSEVTPGVPDKNTVALMMQGIVSPPFAVDTLSASILETALNSMFSAQCPTFVESPQQRFSFESFESSGSYTGQQVKDTDAFCGKYSLKNPWKVYQVGDHDPGIQLSQHKMICFAYKGVLSDSVSMNYSYIDASSNSRVYRTDTWANTFKKDTSVPSTTWYYTCIDMLTLAGHTSDSDHRMIWFRVNRGSDDIYIDAVYIGPVATTTDTDKINLRRLAASQPNGGLIESLSVTSSAANVYRVTLIPYECANQFPLFEIGNGQVSSGSLASSSNAATQVLSGGGTASVAVARLSAASPPVTGTIDVTYNGVQKTGVDITLDVDPFKKELKALAGIGDISVDKSGTCSSFEFLVTFLSQAGDLSEMTVDDTNLNGINAAAAVTTVEDGGLHYDPLTGDMTTAVHTTQQVMVSINDVPCQCSGDCSFSWSASATPTVTDINPDQGTSALSTSVVIDGTGFDTTPNNNAVTIGGVACTVTASTATSITCDVGNGPVGSHRVIVNVAGKGLASHPTPEVTFTYVAAVQNINPSSGSLGGGNILTITGYGLKSAATVTVDGNDCDVLSGTPSEITCRVPLGSAAGLVDVEVLQGSTVLTYSGYTYDTSLTPEVTSVTPTTIPVTGGTVTIDGSNFGTSGNVYIGSVQATVTSYTPSRVVVEVSTVDAGSLQVKLDNGNGYAVTLAGDLPSISAVLEITNVFPTTGSLHGGTILTITGNGFGTNSDIVSVTVGSHSCDISSITDTEVKCQIEDTAVVHHVTNRGTDPVYGIYYAYDDPNLTIGVGDFVRWSWETPEFVNDVTHAVIQVQSPSATTPLSGGFNSGTPSSNGQYQYRFTQTGTFYVWSGYVDTYGRNYGGTIDVINESSYAAEIDVNVAGISAVHNVGGASNPVDSSTCGSLTSSLPGCSTTQPSGSDPTKFYFSFWDCSTPVVSSVTPQSGTASTDMTITGSGFSSANCQNEVKLGASHSFTVKSSSGTSLTCNVYSSSGPEVAISHEVSLRVGNLGYALMNMNQASRTFGLTPSITGISPSGGSLAGGALLTVTGSGFGSPVSVTVNGYACDIASVSYTQIKCRTPSSTSQGEMTVAVVRTISGASLPAICEISNSGCVYSYASTYTSTLDSVNPTSVSGATTLTISGTKFGTSKAALAVAIGGVQAMVSSAQNTVIEVTVQNLPAGNNDVVVTVGDYGKAQGALTVTGVGLISSVVPSSGSIHGKTLVTISGNGFLDTATTVTIDSVTCDLQSVTLSEVTCITRAHADGAVDLVVTSNNVQYTPKTYTYDTASTPTITSISPTQGEDGDTLTITGTNFDPSVDSVVLDNVPCVVVGTTTNAQITCLVGPHATGAVPVEVLVDEKGASNSDINFEYELDCSSINPVIGGIAGGQTVSLVGLGFDSSTAVTICDQPCVFLETTVNLYKCKTPAVSAQLCDVEVVTNGLSVTLPSAYMYDTTLTPSITSVTPTRGGTGGGTTLTVSGSGFGNDANDVSVTIDGADCSITDITDTVLECVTSAHVGSIETTVNVEVGGHGIAQEDTSGASGFYYIDVWSSVFTWGGGPVPAAGEFVVVPAGQTLLLDTDTPVLAFLLIQGGTVIFDETDIELQANYIMITDGGVLQVGTEDAPFQHKAIITLHGHHRSKELPIYGTKVLAVRNGTLDLHGIEIPITWTRLASTAARNSNTLTLTDPVDWKVGDEIVIASTGHHHSQSENEKKNISAISSDKRTLTLSAALEAEHSGMSETFDGTEVEFRAEVGLLTHNVVVRGNRDSQWTEEIKACPDGFNTGEFATQTCFQGRFGDEIGSSQFGGMILVHCPVMDSQCAKAKLSYIEVTFAGQAFRLGRYPIHFHLNGDMSSSYVRGCGIHETFNRAVNIHGSHNTLVEKTVIYNIMGGAFFLEDGIETNNTFQYNLAVFVRESSSLLNDDITPASFWVTNPDNIIQHNAAAGGSHFGFWYRMHKHPDGPSFTESVCPKNVPLGVFNNNTAHSFGWFGLWIFEDYFPLQGGCGGTAVQPAVFQGLTAWNCDKGAEAVNSGALQFENFVLVQNRKAGYEGKKILNVPLYTDDSPMVKDSLIVGTTTVLPSSVQGNTDGGIVFPYGAGFRVKNVRFVNFAVDNSAAFSFARIAGTCSDLCGGYNYHCTGLKFVNANNRVSYGWDWEGILIDVDGSLTGSTAGSSVVPDSGTVPSACSVNDWFSVGVNGRVCPPGYKWHRFAFNNILPSSLEGKNFLITNQYGTSKVQFRDKRLSHKPGWMCALVDGETYEFKFENADQITNISYTGLFESLDSADYVWVEQEVASFPDRFTIDGLNFISATVGGIDPATAMNGDWEWDNVNNKIRYIVHGRQRSRRGMSTYAVDRPFSFSAFKCYYTDCIPPPDPNTVPPADSRSAVFDYWHDVTLWNNSGDYLINEGGSTGVPVAYDNVRILSGTWVVADASIAKLGILLLEGVLEFEDDPTADYEINADCIIIRGGRLIIGWPNDPFDGLASIILRGNHSSPNCPVTGGPTVGAKAIGVFGGLDLFGEDPGVVWTKLSATANRLDTQITLEDSVTWDVDSEIVIGPTGYNAWETERRRVTAVSPDGHTLTLNESLNFRHVAHRETLGTGETINVGAGVGLLSRNIKVIGEDYADMYTESFGARVLVGLIVYNGNTYTGYARLYNVQFYHAGQEGWTETYDPRFAVSYVAPGSVSDVKPSFVSKCAFDELFNSAIGAFGIGGLNVTENVVYRPVGNGIVTNSDDTLLDRNFVALLVWTGAFQNRQEPFNIRFEAGIEAMDADGLILRNNMIAGSERVAYHVPGEACGVAGKYFNNEAHSSLMGVVVFPEDDMELDCGRYSGFLVWKSHDYGIYYNNEDSCEFVDNTLVENGIGLFPMVVGPSATDHTIGDKTIAVSDSLFVGATSSMDCALDVGPTNDDNIDFSSQARPVLGPNRERLAVLFPQCTAGSNSAPKKPWAGIMSYNSIACNMTLEDSTFAHFGSKCNGDFMIATNSKNDDLQHPLHVRSLTLEDVDADRKAFFHRPNAVKINSADCVDMDCDALKKALLKDEDGSLLDHVGAVFSQSEFEWGVNPKRGLGDYRIPKELLTDVDGNRLDVNAVAPNKGIIRNDGCVFHLEWQAWECMADMNHEMMVIESMDPDTETRRISPVAVLGDGYIDLINGPQDHGWCSGYTCRKRLSTFHAVVATGKAYEIYFTSTTPLKLRYMLLNVAMTRSVVLRVWYSRFNRLDTFVNGQVIIPTNAQIDSQGRYRVNPLRAADMPRHENNTGTNVIDRKSGLIHILLKGPDPVEVRTIDVIIVSFGIPALSIDDFFGDDIVENLCAFLDIPLTKVRVVNVVSASGTSGRRRRRQSAGINVEIEIGNAPADDNTTIPDNLDLSRLTELATELVNECQAGNISATLNVTTAECTSVEVPTPSASEGVITYSTPQPDRLAFTSVPVPQYEGVPLSVQPILQAVDQSDVIVTELGTIPSPWQMTVSIRSGTGHPDATLSGTVTVNATNGRFSFTDLAISHMGTGYVLDFNITYPAVAVNFSIASSPIDVSGKPVSAYVVSQTSGDILQNSRFTMTLGLRDSITGEIISDIAWRNHTWSATAQIIGNPRYATMSGILATDFDPVSGTAMFPDLNITGFGFLYIQFTVTSTPADYSFTMNEKIEILNPLHVGMMFEETYEIVLKFDYPYDTVITSDDVKAELEQMMLQEYANFFLSVRLTQGAISRGSIILTFSVAGSAADVNSTAYSLCSSVLNSTSYTFGGLTLTLYPFMTVNGQAFYGVNCGATSAPASSSESLHPGVIAAIVIVVALVVAVVIALVVWKCFMKKKNRTGHVPKGLQYLGNSRETTMETVSRENTFTSMKFNMGASAMATPEATSVQKQNEQNSHYRSLLTPPVVLAFSPEPIHIAKQGAPSPNPLRSHHSISPMPQRQTPFENPGSPTLTVGPNNANHIMKEEARTPSPSGSQRTVSPVQMHSHFSDGESPLPPVGLNSAQYITSQVLQEKTLVLPESPISPPPPYTK